MLDVMYPTSTGRRVINRGSELRLDELKRHKTGLAEAAEIASPAFLARSYS
jgi:hypothetical protein